jgi:hypothetical protein
MKPAPTDSVATRPKSSNIIRALSISQAGSPTRLSDECDHDQPMGRLQDPLPDSTERAVNLASAVRERPSQGVGRRLSYQTETGATSQDATRNTPECEITETTLVESHSGGNQDMGSGAREDSTRLSRSEMAKNITKIHEQVCAEDKRESKPSTDKPEGDKCAPQAKIPRNEVAHKLHQVVDVSHQALEVHYVRLTPRSSLASA